MPSTDQEIVIEQKDSVVMEDRIGRSPLLKTKLYRPPATTDLEQRTRLIERLERNRQRPLTLISAPAGYGKTMLASMWLETCGCPSGWVSLDEVDNDLVTFTSYLLTALNCAFPSLQVRFLENQIKINKIS